jgi:outer membrane protein TolC
LLGPRCSWAGAPPGADSLPPAFTSPRPSAIASPGQPEPIPAPVAAPPAGPGATPAPAAGPPAASGPAGNVYHLTLEEAKQRALGNSKLINLAGLNVDSKGYVVRAAQADYFPKVIGTAVYLHFNDDLGKVVNTPGRTFTGPRGRPLLTLPGRLFEVAVINQDTTIANVAALQPITDLLKVREGVKIAQADREIAQAELEAGVRKLVSGVEQLYWGLLAARRIQAGAVEGLRGAEQLAKTGTLEARTALVESRQAVQQVDQQIADLQEQLNALLDLPLCTTLDLVEPPMPVVPFHCCNDAVGQALANSPEIRQAEQTVVKARAGLAAGKLDFVPSVALTGGFLKQTFADYMQQDIGYIGVVGSYTFLDGGKRRAVIHEREDLVAMATLKLQQTHDDVRQKAVKAFREVAETQVALGTAQEMVGLRKEAEKRATTPEALRNPAALAALLEATKNRMLAEVDAIKADLAYRQAYVNLMTLIGHP